MIIQNYKIHILAQFIVDFANMLMKELNSLLLDEIGIIVQRPARFAVDANHRIVRHIECPVASIRAQRVQGVELH